MAVSCALRVSGKVPAYFLKIVVDIVAFFGHILTYVLKEGQNVKKICSVFLLIITMMLLGACDMGQVQEGGFRLSLEGKYGGTNANSMIDDQLKQSEIQADEVGEEFFEAKDKEYHAILDDVLADDDSPGVSLSKMILLWFYDYYTNIRLWGGPICVVSVLAGAVLFTFAKGNKGMRKFALFGLIIGVPVFYVFTVIGVGALNDVFLY